MPNGITVEHAAEIIGITPGRVRQMLRANELRGEKFSERAWIVDRKSAQKLAKVSHSVGRPRGGKKSA